MPVCSHCRRQQLYDILKGTGVFPLTLSVFPRWEPYMWATLCHWKYCVYCVRMLQEVGGSHFTLSQTLESLEPQYGKGASLGTVRPGSIGTRRMSRNINMVYRGRQWQCKITSVEWLPLCPSCSLQSTPPAVVHVNHWHCSCVEFNGRTP